MSLRDKLREVVTVKDSPHKIAVSFATGVFIGMSPLIGVHTLLGITAAWYFKLNKLVALIGVYVTNPWTIVPIYSFGTWVGARMLGMQKIIPEIEWDSITLLGFIGKFRHLVVPFFIGNTVMAIGAAVIGYFLVYCVAKSGRE